MTPDLERALIHILDVAAGVFVKLNQLLDNAIEEDKRHKERLGIK